MKILLTILLFLSAQRSFSDSTCSRIATINYQEVLVDSGTGKMGEGLRFYLEKDPESLALLDEYQKKSKPTPWTAGASTVGSIMILSGLLQTGDQSPFGDKNTLISGGAILVTLSYLMTKTVKLNNEKFLNLAIDQYNKRNSPRIYFSPFRDNNGESGVGFGLQKEF